MLVTVGITTTRTGHKVHRHVNGWATCGAGRLIESPRFVVEGDQLCRRCARHLDTMLIWEIDDMRRKHCYARATMLERFMDSGMTVGELDRQAAFLAELGANLMATWAYQELPTPLPTVDRTAGTLTLF